ncbi:MAG: glutamate-1-semialdehyde-2,1-aminomutase [Sulfobacillus benefaciens]|uniref:Glutamate-1-semialdehyde 2,1-aminomutase n=1 Tax=Sulfobacillus benefaciens TaxID=453960 RepID=A0A2T2XCW8_9FIRM|nr:MAG: glutamate-1-semialdehyde-2,1-aminomutase [Sulfobacillus benefaciens]
MTDWWQRAQAVMPGGVNSPVRSFRGVGGTPFFVKSGQGPYLMTEDGRTLIDYVMGYGPLILGHAAPEVVQAVQHQASLGLGYGAPTVQEVTYAELLTREVPGLDIVRLVNSGTEATMSALRVARAVTGRHRVVKFAGCYHGHHDSLLIKAGSGAATLGVPDSAGVPAQLAALTITVPYNDIEALTAAFNEYGSEIAAVIMEPVAGNMGTVLPLPGYLAAVQNLAHQHGALWVVDEVMTGFRVAWGGAMKKFDLIPDLVSLAKVIGAGMPLGAYGGKREYMSLVAPLGPVYQAGTFSGNPIAVAAGSAQLKAIGGPDFYLSLEQRTQHLAQELVAMAIRHEIPAATNAIGGMFTLFFSDKPPTNFSEVEQTDRDRYRRFFHGMLERGIYFPPSPFETLFVSHAHSDEVIEATLSAADEVFRTL